MEIRLFCPNCSHHNRVMSFEAKNSYRCVSCKKAIPWSVGAELKREGLLTTCVLCKKDYFYRRPLFNKGLGCALLLVAIALSPWTYGMSLVAAWLVDFFLFKRLPRVVACYVCDSEYVGTKPEAPEFDLHLHEKYRKHRELWGQMT